MFEQSLSKPSFTKKIQRLATKQWLAKNACVPRPCQICGDKANIINYGALSCQPCKTFFRRNGFHPESVSPCLNNGLCNINKETRRSCSSCRLAKCISKGMSSDFIRKEEKKSTKPTPTPGCKRKIHTTCMSTKSSEQSHPKRYLFFDYQKTIVSNVVHALEIYSAIPKVRDIIEDELAFIFDLPFNASSATECINHIFTSIRYFINSIPDFRIMVIGEQSSLFRRNFNCVVSLYSALVFRQTGITHRSDLITSFAAIYGSEMMIKLIQISKQLNVDLTTIKLMLLILAFSSNSSVVDYRPDIHDDSLLTGTFRLWGSQDAYVAVLWKHMVCRYGYYKAACHFSQLIGVSVDLIRSLAITSVNHESYHELVNEFHWNNEQWLLTNQREQVHL